jgi:hypothetical protein
MKSERVSLGPTKANLSNLKRSACGILGLGGVLIQIIKIPFYVQFKI